MIDQQYKSELVEWCDEAENMLSRAVHNCSIEDLQQQVEYGASLFKLSVNDELIGYYIIRIDHLKYWSEAVYVAGSGDHKEHNLTEISVLMVEKQVSNCRFLRIHTERAGMVKKLVNLGFKPQEFIMQKELN